MATSPYEIRLVKDGLHFPEGPRWHDGRLYFSDMYAQEVIAIDGAGNVEIVCKVPNLPSGLGFAPDGDLLVVSMNDRRVLRLKGHRLVEIADLSELAKSPCNDMVVDTFGRAYVGNFGWNTATDSTIRATNLLLVRDGVASIAAHDLNFPNGMAISPDGRTLLVAETFASRISAFDIQSDGALVGRRTWARLSNESYQTITDAVASGCSLPDGITLDADGALWIGDAGGTAALRVAEGGKILEKIDTGELSVYAVALGGPNRSTLFMCAAARLGQGDPATERKGVILSCDVDVPGTGIP